LRPFAVGNNRLALALGGYLLDLYGYNHVRSAPIEEVVAERRDELEIALDAAGGDWEDATSWVHAFVEVVCEAEQRVLDGAAGPEPARLSPRLGRLLDLMKERRAAKIGDLLPVLETPRATLKKDLKALVEAGYLTTEGVRKGTVYFVRE
jgi:Fic family protein